MFCSCNYGNENTSVGKRPKDDGIADTVYELFGKDADLWFPCRCLFPWTQCYCDDFIIFYRYSYRNFVCLYFGSYNISRGTGSVCYGVTELSFSECEECGKTDLG